MIYKTLIKDCATRTSKKSWGEVHRDTRRTTVKRHDSHQIWILHWTPGYAIEYK